MRKQFFFETAKLVPRAKRFIFSPVTMTRHGIVVKVCEPDGCTIGNAENTGNGRNVENVHNERNGSAEGRGIRKWKLTLTSVRAWLAMARRGQIKTHCRKQWSLGTLQMLLRSTKRAVARTHVLKSSCVPTSLHVYYLRDKLVEPNIPLVELFTILSALVPLPTVLSIISDYPPFNKYRVANIFARMQPVVLSLENFYATIELRGRLRLRFLEWTILIEYRAQSYM